MDDTVILDTGAEINVISDSNLLTSEARSAPEPILISGIDKDTSVLLDQVADTEIAENVYYAPGKVRGNVYSFGKLRNQGKILGYNRKKDYFRVKGKRGILRFGRSRRCNAYHLMSTSPHRNDLKKMYPISVRDKMKQFTKRELTRAAITYAYLRRMLYPSKHQTLKIIKKGYVRNLPFSVNDVTRAFYIWGTPIARIRGQSTGHRQATYEEPERAESDVLSEEVQTASFDIMEIAGTKTLVGYVKPLCYTTGISIPNKDKDTLIKGIFMVRDMLKAHGYTLKRLRFDREAGVVYGQPELLREGILIDQGEAGGHISDVERMIRQIKEGARTILNSDLGYELPQVLVPHMIKAIIMKLNLVAGEQSEHTGVSPKESLTGGKPDAKVEYALAFGQLVETLHAKTSNSMVSRSETSVALYPIGDTSKAWRFLNLRTGKFITRRKWQDTAPGMLALETIGRYAPHKIARKELDVHEETSEGEEDEDKEPVARVSFREESSELETELISNDRPTTGVEQQEVETELISNDGPTTAVAQQEGNHTDANVLADSAPGADTSSTDTDPQLLRDAMTIPDDDSDVDTVDLLDEIGLGYSSSEDSMPDLVNSDDEDSEPEGSSQDNPHDDTTHDESDAYLRQMGVGDIHGNTGTNPQPTPESEDHVSEDDRDPDWTPPRSQKRKTPEHTTNKKRTRSGGPTQDTTTEADTKRARVKIISERIKEINVIREHYRVYHSIQKGLKLYGDRAREAIQKELHKLVKFEVFEAVKKDVICDGVLPSHMIVQKSRSGDVKARWVGNGAHQNVPYKDTYSPTVHAESVLAIGAYAAAHSYSVAAIDYPGAYLNAPIPEDWDPIYVRIGSDVVRELLKLYPEYEQYVREDKTVIVRLKKALYGCKVSGRLWYLTLARYLEETLGFTASEFDPCIFTKTDENGSITFLSVHVDDLLLMCDDETHLNELIDDMKKKFGIISDLKVQKGPDVEYLGMTLRFSYGALDVDMEKYTAEILKVSGVKGTAATPATNDLFNDDESTALEGEKKDFFYSTVYQLFYLSKRGRPDILLPVSYLTTRVTKSNKGDLKKLWRVLKYLNGHRNLVLRLKVDKFGKNGKGVYVHQSIDAAYGVSSDFRSQSGSTITLGRGACSAKSGVQKINSKSSSEAELIALSDYVGDGVWYKNFFESLGIEVGGVEVEQDNLSCLRMVERGYSTSSKGKHIPIRYFYVKDVVDREKVILVYRSTDQIIADGLTKPLQGKHYQAYRKRIMGSES